MITKIWSNQSRRKHFRNMSHFNFLIWQTLSFWEWLELLWSSSPSSLSSWWSNGTDRHTLISGGYRRSHLTKWPVTSANTHFSLIIPNLALIIIKINFLLPLIIITMLGLTEPLSLLTTPMSLEDLSGLRPLYKHKRYEYFRRGRR